MLPMIPFTKIQKAEIPEKKHEFTTERNIVGVLWGIGLLKLRRASQAVNVQDHLEFCEKWNQQLGSCILYTVTSQ